MAIDTGHVHTRMDAPTRADECPAPDGAEHHTTAGRSLARRVATAALGLPLVAWALVHGGAWWATLLAVASALATDEYMRLVRPGSPTLRALAIATSASLPAVAMGRSIGEGLGHAFLVLVLAGLVAWFLHLRGPDNSAAAVGVGHLLAGVMLPAGGIVSLVALREMTDGVQWAAIVLAAAWGSDTAAFFVGRKWGRRRICPRISPGKSWEGLVGGAVAACVVVVASTLWTPALTWIDRSIIALVASIVGPLGDLSKSMVKRAHNVKDFGRLLPGHGGILDRIDALVFDAPLILLWAHWLRP